jgi:hypothetical protein
MPLPVTYLDFYRNIKGRWDLMLFLCRWDPGYRKDIIVISLALGLIGHALIFWHGLSSLLAAAMGAGIVGVQLGRNISVLPADFRPATGRDTYKAVPGNSIARGEKSFLMSGVFPAAPEEVLGFRNPLVGAGLCRDSALASGVVDDALMLKPAVPWREEPPKRLPVRSRHQLRYLATRVANKTQHVTNGVTVALDDMADALVSERSVTLRKAYYFDALLTDEAFRSRLLRSDLRGESEVFADLTANFPAEEQVIGGQESLRFAADFTKQVSGHIGITTLLVTENRRIAMLTQGSRNAVGSGTVTFGGSGTMAYGDLSAVTGHEDLREVLSYAMARELCEETGLQKYFGEVRANTMVTGFFRWIDRCGKPEFIGLTRAEDVPFSKERAIDGDEVVRYEEIPVFINTLSDFNKALAWVRDNKINVALSSVMALHRLTVIAAYAAADAAPEQRRIYQRVSEFLFGSLAYLDKTVETPYALKARGGEG